MKKSDRKDLTYISKLSKEISPSKAKTLDEAEQALARKQINEVIGTVTDDDRNKPITIQDDVLDEDLDPELSSSPEPMEAFDFGERLLNLGLDDPSIKLIDFMKKIAGIYKIVKDDDIDSVRIVSQSSGAIKDVVYHADTRTIEFIN